MLGRALAATEVNQLGRDTGQAQRLRTVTPHRLFLAMVSTLGSGRVESLADLLRAFNHQHDVEVGPSEPLTVDGTLIEAWASPAPLTSSET